MIENNAKCIRVLAAGGAELGRIASANCAPFPQGLTNAAFGGADRKTLFIRGFIQGSSGGIYSIQLNVPGLP